MNEEARMAFIAEALDVEADSISPETRLNSLEEWDSVSVITLVAMIDDTYNTAVKGEELRANETVADLMAFIGKCED